MQDNNGKAQSYVREFVEATRVYQTQVSHFQSMGESGLAVDGNDIRNLINASSRRIDALAWIVLSSIGVEIKSQNSNNL